MIETEYKNTSSLQNTSFTQILVYKNWWMTWEKVSEYKFLDRLIPF